MATAAAAEGIGQVAGVGRWAYGTPPGRSRSGLFVRDAVVTNEVVETVPRGALHLAFHDGSIFRLGANSRATLDRFVYDPNSKAGQFEVNLRSGMFRLKTGQMKKEGILVITPVAFISVAGTDFIVQVFLNGAIVVAVLSGQVVISPLVPGAAPAVVTAGSAVGVGANGQVTTGASYPPRDRGLDDDLPGSGTESQGDAEGGGQEGGGHGD